MAEAAAVVRASDLFGAGSRSASRGPAVDWMEHMGQGSKLNSPEPRPEMDTNHFPATSGHNFTIGCMRRTSNGQ
jgi:hypothetical protein